MALDIPKLTGGLAVVGNAGVAMAVGLGDLNWTDVQNAAVILEVNAAIAVIVALYAHFRKNTTAEPVAILGTLFPFVSGLLGLAIVFVWFGVNADDGTLIETFVIAVFALIGVPVVRSKVTPEWVPPPGFQEWSDAGFPPLEEPNPQPGYRDA